MSELTKKDLDAALRENRQSMCPADRETYDSHCRILAQLEQTLPRIDKTMEKINETLEMHTNDLTILKTDKRWIMGLSAVIGGIAGWFSRHI